MTNVNHNSQKFTPQSKKEIEVLNVKPQQAISVLDSGNASYQVDVTPVLLQKPYSPFAIALSVSIVIGAIASLMKTLKQD